MKSAANEKLCFRLRVTMLFILSVVLLGTAAYGQGTATIVGTVTDPTGAVVPNARITITNLDQGFVRTTDTNTAGSYDAPELPIGRFQVQVEASGFKTYDRTDVTLNVNDTVRVDALLQVGTVGQSVTVQANALQVQADTSEVSHTVTGEDISNLATNGRNNILQLTVLVPGTSSELPDLDSPGAQFQSHAVFFNGMRQDDNNWLIDGGEAYDRGGGGIMLVAPSQEAIDEFKVETSNYAADLGNSSGGMTSIAIKSGTKQFHGSAWEFNRNDVLDAYSYLSKQNANPTKPELRYNLFGFNTAYAHCTLIPDASGIIAGRFRFTCHLQPGDYSITVRVMDFLSETANELLDKQVNGATFKVTSRQKTFDGVVDLAGTFEPAPNPPRTG